MIGILFILFNLSLYYTLSGFYLYMFAQTPPFVWGIPILVLITILYIALSTKVFPKIYAQGENITTKPIVIFLCLLPTVAIAFDITLVQALHFLPAWAMTVIIILTERLSIRADAFKAHFSFTARLFLLFSFALFGAGRIIDSFASVVIYLIIYLLSGMTLLRVLRQDGQLSKSRNIVVMLILFLVGVLFTMLNMQYVLTSGLAWLYQGVVWIIVVVSVAVAFVLSTIVSLFNFEITYNGALNGEADYSFDEYTDVNELIRLAGDFDIHFPDWIPTAVVFVVFAVFVLLLLRKLLKNVKKRAKGNSNYLIEEEYAVSKSQYKKKNKRKILRPNDPRLAIRWYYRKYIKEGISRGAEAPLVSDTTEKILKKYSPFFLNPEAGELRDLYISARYQDSTEVTKKAADKAAKLWKKINN